MKDKKIYLKRPLLIVIVICLVSISLFGAATYASADGEVDINTNEYGQTYGAPYEGVDGLVVEPDLVRVEATNGKIGYLSPVEMHLITSEYAEGVDEEVRLAIDLGERKAAALKNSVEKFYGTDLVSFEDARLCTALLEGENGQEKAIVSFNKEIAEPLAKAARDGKVDSKKISTSTRTNSIKELEAKDIIVNKKHFDTIYETARAELAVSVPVYESDGRTVIGEAIIDRM